MTNPRRLDPEAVSATAERLYLRVQERFPDRGISRLATELVTIAEETRARVGDLRRPRRALRAGIAFAAALVLTAIVVAATQVDSGARVGGVNDFVGFVESLIQDVVFLGLGAAFLFGIEGRLKRRTALAGLHDLRSFAHVIDMHQLTKDPEFVISDLQPTSHSPDRIDDRVLLGRYLEYCSEMLALTSKLAASYAFDNSDAVVLGAIREIQELVGLLSGKIWQKRVILDTAS
jgi:hypothetical protein